MTPKVSLHGGGHIANRKPINTRSPRSVVFLPTSEAIDISKTPRTEGEQQLLVDKYGVIGFDFRYGLPLDRPPVIPIMKIESRTSHEVPLDYSMGRVLIDLATSDRNGDHSVLDGLGDLVTPRDIVHVPLFLEYRDCREDHEGIGVIRRSVFDRNMGFIRESGRSVRAILVGNDESEITSRYLKNNNARKNSAHLSEFIKRVADLVLPHANLVIAPVDWDLATDCYFGGGMMRDVMRDLGITQWCAPGMKLWTGGCPNVNEPTWNILCPKKENPPQPELTEYVKSIPTMMGVGYSGGLMSGNDRVLKSHGVIGGVIGMGLANPMTAMQRRRVNHNLVYRMP